MPEFKENPSPFRMKSSPAKMWPFGKVKKTKRIEDGYEIVDKTRTRGNTVVTKSTKRLIDGEDSKDGVVKTKNVTKTKDGKVVRSKNVLVDRDGHRKLKTVSNKRRTKTTEMGYSEAGGDMGDSGVSWTKSKKIKWH